jgi:hypothetical protein
VPPLAWVLTALAVAPAGEAQASAGAPVERAACPAEPGDRDHGGFFARSEPGVALLFADVDDAGPEPRRTRVHGIGQSAALSLGATPWRGWVVGGRLWTARIDPVFHEGGLTVNPDDDSVKLTLLHVGPFVDWYPDARRGLHFLASSSFTIQVETDTKGNGRAPHTFGAALGAGGGYEWFLASEFSLGATLRTTLGVASRAQAGGAESTAYVIPELALSATYH